MVFSPDRLIESRFSWGLGVMSNNQAECYNLLLASQIAKEKGYKSILIFGDSEMLIKVLNSVDQLNNVALNKILLRTRNVLKNLDGIASFHILRDLNHLADALANKACLLTQGILCINRESSY